MIDLLTFAVASVGVLGTAASHIVLRRRINDTHEAMIAIVTGSLREIGPAEAQEKALKSQAALRIAERHAARISPLNL